MTPITQNKTNSSHPVTHGNQRGPRDWSLRKLFSACRSATTIRAADAITVGASHQ